MEKSIHFIARYIRTIGFYTQVMYCNVKPVVYKQSLNNDLLGILVVLI